MPTIEERIKEICGSIELEEDMKLSYTWDHGYEMLTITGANGGGLTYAGAYHPNGLCKGNPCEFCGKVWVE